MSSKRNLSRVIEAVGVFKEVEFLESAIDDLMEHGFDRSDLSLLASEEALNAKIGHHFIKVEKLEDNPNVLRSAYVARESIGAGEGALIGTPMYVVACTAAGIVAAAGGPLTALILAAIAGGGGGALIGTMLARLVGQNYSKKIEQQLEQGGLILWIRTWSDDQKKKTLDILARHSAEDIHLHDFSSVSRPSQKFLLDYSSSPEEIFNSDQLSRHDKIIILQYLEYDARELLVAQEEGMTNQESDLLDRVLQALHGLGVVPELDNRPPTKQGGI